MKLTVNGIEIPVEKTIDIKAVIHPNGDRLDSIVIKVVGGVLTVKNPDGAAFTLDVDTNSGAQVRLMD